MSHMGNMMVMMVNSSHRGAVMDSSHPHAHAHSHASSVVWSSSMYVPTIISRAVVDSVNASSHYYKIIDELIYLIRLNH